MLKETVSHSISEKMAIVKFVKMCRLKLRPRGVGNNYILLGHVAGATHYLRRILKLPAQNSNLRDNMGQLVQVLMVMLGHYPSLSVLLCLLDSAGQENIFFRQ